MLLLSSTGSSRGSLLQFIDSFHDERMLERVFRSQPILVLPLGAPLTTSSKVSYLNKISKVWVLAIEKVGYLLGAWNSNFAFRVGFNYGIVVFVKEYLSSRRSLCKLG